MSVLLFVLLGIASPEVKVTGAMKNVMMKGDLSAHIDIDTLQKQHLYGLGPVAQLKGEIMILDGKVFSTEKHATQLVSTEDKISKAALLVYSHVAQWKAVTLKTTIKNYVALEKLVEATAKTSGYDIEIPFAFKIEASPQILSFHVIDWKDGTVHTMENHKQFAYSGKLKNEKVWLLGFYSTHHQGVFTHHTTYMHVHMMDEKTKTVGHLDELELNGTVTIYLPVQ